MIKSSVKFVYGLFAVVLLFIAGCPLAQAQSTDTALYINADGNVGIGTVNPQNKLQLGGNLHMDGNAIFFRHEAQNKSSFIRWNILDFTKKKDDDKLAIVAWNGVKLGDFSQGGEFFFPILNVSRGNTSGVVDIMTIPRANPEKHPANAMALYVTGGEMKNRGEGVEFRNNEGTEGLGFTRNLIYGTGADQNINFEVTGKGNFSFKTGGTERMFVNSEGKVGITNGVISELQMRGKIYWDWPERCITQVNPPAPGAAYIQFSNSETSSGNPDGGFRFVSYKAATATMRIRDKFVGIGTDDPQAPLNVKSVRGSGTNYDDGVSSDNSHELGWNGVIYKTHRSGVFRHFNTCSILAEGDIVTKSVLVSTETKAYSDIRLKKDITPSSPAGDLATLEKIAVVNYRMIDTIANDRSYKKVIAQQVQEVYPIAVSSTSRTLPDVFQRAVKVDKLSDSSYVLTVARPEDLKAGDQLELKCNPANDVTVRVDKILDKTSFVVTSGTALDMQANVFVYGRPSDDVLTVDYDALSMLNLSATQQLATLIKAQQKEIERLKKENAGQSVVISTILDRLSKLEQEKERPRKQLAAASVQE